MHLKLNISSNYTSIHSGETSRHNFLLTGFNHLLIKIYIVCQLFSKFIDTLQGSEQSTEQAKFCPMMKLYREGSELEPAQHACSI